MNPQAFIIEGRMAGLNELTLANRGNRYAGAAMKKAEQERVGWAIKAARLKPVTAPCRLHFTWVEPNGRRDLDNVGAGKKMVLDALVSCGILAGDGRKHVTGFSDTFPPPDKGNPHVRVRIEEEEHE